MRTSKLKWCKAPRVAKSSKKGPELVENCDGCGRPLGRDCARTAGSAICAAGDGIPHLHRDDQWLFFCCIECLDSYERN